MAGDGAPRRSAAGGRADRSHRRRSTSRPNGDDRAEDHGGERHVPRRPAQDRLESARTIDLPALVSWPKPTGRVPAALSPIARGPDLPRRGRVPIRRKVFRAEWVKALEGAKISKHVLPGRLRHPGSEPRVRRDPRPQAPSARGWVTPRRGWLTTSTSGSRGREQGRRGRDRQVVRASRARDGPLTHHRRVPPLDQRATSSDLERTTGFEPATPTLARWCSTAEPRPRGASSLGAPGAGLQPFLTASRSIRTHPPRGSTAAARRPRPAGPRARRRSRAGRSGPLARS